VEASCGVEELNLRACRTTGSIMNDEMRLLIAIERPEGATVESVAAVRGEERGERRRS
jgi:hypothetical protein